MSPLLLAGATSVAKYLASRTASHAPALPVSGNIGKDFSSVLRAAVGPQSSGLSPDSQARLLEKQLLEAPEVKSALASQPLGAVSSLRVQQDGSVTLIGPGVEVGVAVGAIARTTAQQIFSSNVTSLGAGVPITVHGIQAVSVRLPGVRVA